MNGIYWLVSYPKSGNTWLRIFITNLKNNGKESVDINTLPIPLAASSKIFEDYTGLSPSNLELNEIDRLRPLVHEKIAEKSEVPQYLKVHNAYLFTDNQQPLFSPQVTNGAIYIVRNPLDVAVSFASHASKKIDWVIAKLNDDDYSLAIDPLARPFQLRERLLDWGGHVRSWLDAKEVNVHLMRYEDMCLAPIPTFQAAARFLNLPNSLKEIENAVNLSSFDRLKAQEMEKGFSEKPHNVESFFRKGQIGSWRESLTEEQARKIISAQGEMMHRLGYLNEKGEPVY